MELYQEEHGIKSVSFLKGKTNWNDCMEYLDMRNYRYHYLSFNDDNNSTQTVVEIVKIRKDECKML